MTARSGVTDRDSKPVSDALTGSRSFAARAAMLSGQASVLLGWRPEEFWKATPAELAAILQAFNPPAECAADGQMLMTLMEMFPDG